MRDVLIKFLEELGIEYVPGIKVRIRAWQSNSSSDHTAWLSGLEVPEKLNLDDYPYLKQRTINNVLYVETTSIDDYINKSGFYFSEDHYTIINKINYALSLACYGGGYSSSVYVPKTFFFHNKRELEESKRILIKFYTSFTKPVKLALIKHFGFDNVVFSFDKIVKTVLTIENPDPNEVFKTLIHSGLYCSSDTEVYEALKEKKVIDLYDFFDIESVDGNCSDAMENNIYESEETLADFLFSDKSEVFPYSEGSESEVFDVVKSSGQVIYKEDKDDIVKLSCQLLVRDYEADPDKLQKVTVKKTASLSRSVFESVYDGFMTNLSDRENTVYGQDGKITSRYKDIIGWSSAPELVFDPDLHVPVVVVYYNNAKTKDNASVLQSYGVSQLLDGTYTIDYHDSSSGGLVDISGKILPCFLHVSVPEIDIVKDILKKFIDENIDVSPWRSNLGKRKKEDIENKDIRNLSNELGDFLNKSLTHVGDVFFDKGGAGEVLCSKLDITNPKIFTKEEKAGFTYYWLKLSSFMDVFKLYEESIDTNYLKFCKILYILHSTLGPDWIDKVIYTIPVDITHSFN